MLRMDVYGMFGPRKPQKTITAMSKPFFRIVRTFICVNLSIWTATRPTS